MSFQGREEFSSDTGQFTAGVAGNSIPGGAGTFTFTGGVGRFASAGGAKNDSRAHTSVDPPDSACYVTLDLLDVTFPVGAISYFYTQPALWKDSGNFMVPGVGPHVIGGNDDDYSFQLIIFKGGTRTNYSGQTLTLPGGVTAHKVALAIDGKFLDIWLYKTATNLWTRIAHQDISVQFDMSVVGALTDYKPAIIYWTDASGSLGTDVDNLQWGPTSDFTPAFEYEPPQNLNVTGATPVQVDLAWDEAIPTFGGGALTAPAGYIVYRDGVQLAWVGTPGQLTYSDTTVFAGHTYEYTVAAADMYGDPISAQSTLVSVTTSGGATTNYIVLFRDEEIFTGYLGGKLRGTTVACPGDNANKVKPCC